MSLSSSSWGRRGQSPPVDLLDLLVRTILPIGLSIGRFLTSPTSYWIHTVCTQYIQGLVAGQEYGLENDLAGT